ncbi:MAG TPA: class IV adenylate cyclase [Candidatus Acidoferrales bacterium]|nr:class IV adenylate cyclase [Candidatus Acidoferrales bacterium]
MALTRCKTNLEIEVKLRISDLAALLQDLHKLRAKVSPSVLERNTLYDTPSRDFSRRGSILRIRTELPAAAPDSARRIPRVGKPPLAGLLTYKGLLPKLASRNSRYKIREEIEFRLPNALRFERLFLRLGLRPWFRYEKFRTTYRLPRIPGLHLDLDETPCGAFLELDGSQQTINQAARLLGFGPADYITVSYLELYLADCRRRGRKPAQMVFLRKKSLR